MLALIAPLLTSIFGSAFSSIVDGYKAKLAATNTQDQQAVNLAIKEIEAEIAARAEATRIMMIENGRWWTAAPRAIVCWAFAIFVAKVVVYDKVLGAGTTDPLSGDVAQWAGMLMAVWFGGRTLEKVAQVFGRK